MKMEERNCDPNLSDTDSLENELQLHQLCGDVQLPALKLECMVGSD